MADRSTFKLTLTASGLDAKDVAVLGPATSDPFVVLSAKMGTSKMRVWKSEVRSYTCIHSGGSERNFARSDDGGS